MTHEAPRTILELIKKSVATPNIGQGQEATVYNVADPRFPELVIRIFDDGSLEELRETTSLTPVNYGYGTKPLAPSILQGGGVAFHLRQDGTSLTRLWRQLAQKSNQWEAYASVLEKLAGQDMSAYEALLSNMNFLTSVGRSIEPLGDNIMLSDKNIRWVDIGHRPTQNHLESVRQMMFNFNLQSSRDSPAPVSPSSDVQERIREAKEAIDKKLRQAAKNTHTPFNESELQAQLARPGNEPRFSMAQPITSVAKLPLSATPEQLRRTLDEIEDHLGLRGIRR